MSSNSTIRKGSMNRSELQDRVLAKHSQLSKKDVEAIFKIFFSELSDSLAKGDRVEIRGFGSFCLRTRPPRKGRNPKTGETVMLPIRVSPYFKPGKQLKERVKPIK